MLIIPKHTDHNGQLRRLGLLPSTDNCRKVRAGARNISAITPLLQQSQWKEVDYVTSTDPALINNQGQEGACVGASCAGASQRQRWFREGVVIPLSWQYVYDQINGGQDNGAVITDAQGVMTGSGCPAMSDYPKSLFRSGKMPAGVPIYKEDEAITITGSIDAATALISLGAFPQLGIDVTSNFEQFTSAGVAWGGVAPRSSSANHSIYVAGLRQVAGQWCFILVNSWGQWGPTNEGWCLIPVAAVDNPAVQDGGWLHLSTAASNDTPVSPVS